MIGACVVCAETMLDWSETIFVYSTGSEKLSVSRACFNFWRLTVLCTTLYRKPTKASSFGGKFDYLLP